jgi:hypothetical protein
MDVAVLHNQSLPAAIALIILIVRSQSGADFKSRARGNLVYRLI